MKTLKRPTYPAVAIDPGRFGDFDDAIGLERFGNRGEKTLRIAIADVCALVTKDSNVDIHGRRLGFTKYGRTSETTSFLFGREICENLGSLIAGEPKLAITLSFPISPRLHIGSPTIERSYVQVARNLTYQEADEQLQGLKSEYGNMLRELEQISNRLSDSRKAASPIGNAVVVTDKLLADDENTRSHKIIEELMILANKTVAELLAKLGVPSIFRNHEFKRTQTGEIKNAPARYGVESTGHEAVGHKHYLHFTSPLRRYPDLLVHEVVNAVIDAKDTGMLVLPREREELLVISDHLNEQEQTCRRFISFGIGERISSKPVEKLTKKEFEIALIRKIEEGNLDQEFADELRKRIRENELNDRSRCALIFAPRGSSFDELIQEMKNQIIGPENAVRVFNAYERDNRIGFEELHYIDSVDPHLHVIEISVEIPTIPKVFYTTAVATTKKKARGLATIAVLEKMTGLEFDQHIPKHKTYVEELESYCKATKTRAEFIIDYDFDKTGSEDILCGCAVTIGARIITSIGEAKTEAEAKEKAAKSALAQINGFRIFGLD